LENKENVEEFVKCINEIEITIYVNWMPLWKVKYGREDLQPQTEQNPELYILALQKKVEPLGLGIEDVYGELFEDGNAAHAPVNEERAALGSTTK
jgi:hypothetical protein